MGGQDVEPGGARAVSDERSGRQRGRGTGDLRIGDAEQHGVDLRGPLPAAERSRDVVPGAAERGRQRVTDPPLADDRQARTGRGLGGWPFQFPH